MIATTRWSLTFHISELGLLKMLSSQSSSLYCDQVTFLEECLESLEGKAITGFFTVDDIRWIYKGLKITGSSHRMITKRMEEEIKIGLLEEMKAFIKKGLAKKNPVIPLVVSGFGVGIIGGRQDKAYVYLYHKDEYEIVLNNYTSEASDAEVFLDGKNIGTFRVDRRSSFTIESHPLLNRRFTFAEDGSDLAAMGGLDDVNPEDRGRVKVIFHRNFSVDSLYRKESIHSGHSDMEVRRNGTLSSSSSPSRVKKGPTRSSSGGTVLGSEYTQNTTKVPSIDVDARRDVQINLLLLPESKEPEVIAIPAGNPVPNRP